MNIIDIDIENNDIFCVKKFNINGTNKYVISEIKSDFKEYSGGALQITLRPCFYEDNNNCEINIKDIKDITEIIIE